MASSRCFWWWPNQNTHTLVCVLSTRATSASNADSLICSVIRLATENYVLVQLLSLIINSMNGQHNFLQEEKKNKVLQKHEMKETMPTVHECTASCLLLPSTTICVLYLCRKSKLHRGEAHKVLTKAAFLVLLMQHCCYSCHSEAKRSDRSPFMYEADHKLLPSQADFWKLGTNRYLGARQYTSTKQAR